MADLYYAPGTPTTPSNMPTPLRRLEEDHAPSIPSPLNPDASRPRAPPKPVAREQREKKDSLKKRESAANARGGTPDVKSTFKAPQVAGPKRVTLPAPDIAAYFAHKDVALVSREPEPLFAPDGTTELKKPIDIAYNRNLIRWHNCVADPLFPHKQFYRLSEGAPYTAQMSITDSDKNFYYDQSCRIITNEKGWRMSRANVFAREGSMYFEVKVLNGIPEGTPINFQETGPQPHIRMGWARREAPLDAPVGFDGYSYGIIDSKFETLHRSRIGKFLAPKTKAKSKTQQTSQDTPLEPIRQGDVIGLLITLPPLPLHRKVVAGTYNPAVDFSATPDPDAAPPDIIRDRIPIISRGLVYFETYDYQATKAMKQYSERTPVNTVRINPNHEEIPLRSLPHSSIKVYRNGAFVGTAFDNLLAFLPPASMPTAEGGVRQGFDDGSPGYYPVVSVFNGGVAEVNLGPNFWHPPAELNLQQDVQMDNSGSQLPPSGEELMKPRAISERYAEQIAEDIVWDIIDEATFFVADGGYA